MALLKDYVLGPDLFKIYVRSLRKEVEPARFDIFGFADDHQLLKTFLPIFQVTALQNDIQYCFELISKWMNKYFLCLNASKTKILIIVPPSLRGKIVIHGTFINDKCVRFVSSAKNLGVILDDELSFSAHITKLVKSCFFTIRNLSKIKSYLTFEQLRTVVYGAIFSRLDYCNSLFYGINSVLLGKLQSVQNSAVRLLRKKNGLCRISTDDFIRKCHWLRVKARILFKLCLIVHKCLHGIAPGSLQVMLTYNTSSRTMKLNEPPYHKSCGDRRFGRIAPKLWNLLPSDIRTEVKTDVFKRQLKPYIR